MTKPKTPLKRDQIIAALHACGGGVYLAAKQLGCAPTTIYRRMERDAKLAAVVEGIRGELVDIAEAGLRRKALEGDTTALIWITKTLGKSRGYVERQEVSGPNGAPIQVQPIDYRAAIAPLAPLAGGSVGDSNAPGKNQDNLHGAEVG